MRHNKPYLVMCWRSSWSVRNAYRREEPMPFDIISPICISLVSWWYAFFTYIFVKVFPQFILINTYVAESTLVSPFLFSWYTTWLLRVKGGRTRFRGATRGSVPVPPSIILSGGSWFDSVVGSDIEDEQEFCLKVVGTKHVGYN